MNHFPVVIETETSGAVSAYVPGLPVYAAANTHAKAEQAIRSTLAAYLAAHPAYAGDQADIPGVISWPFAVAVVYTVSTFGSIFGGWLPKQFINGGMDANKARKLAMFIFALFPLTVLLASRLGAINTWLAVATIAIATAVFVCSKNSPRPDTSTEVFSALIYAVRAESATARRIHARRAIASSVALV